MKRYVYVTLALLALMTGQAHAQRCLPGMKGVRLTAEMADGFYCGANRHDAGYAFSLAVSTYTKKGNQWVFGGETLRRNIPYRNTHIPTAQYTGEGGYYHTFFSSPGKVLFLNLGVSALLGYETVNGGKRLLDDGAALHRWRKATCLTGLSCCFGCVSGLCGAAPRFAATASMESESNTFSNPKTDIYP